jgi:hypothetical protein
MPRIAADPSLQICPDFASPAFAPACNALALALHVDPEAAIGNLTASWTAENTAQRAAWALQVEEDAAAQQIQELDDQNAAAAIQAQADREADDALKELWKKKPKMHTFDTTKSVGADIMSHPSPYVLERVKKFEYVELWYFSPEGTLDTATTQCTSSEDTFGISRSDSDFMVLKPVSAIHASRKALRDEDLSWDQMEIGATRLLRHMRLYQWPDVTTDALAVFWYKLQNHEMRNCPNGQWILKAYQAQVRCEWHAALDRKDPGFNISLIDDALLAKITQEAFEADCQATLQEVSVLSSPFLDDADSLLPPSVSVSPHSCLLLCSACCTDLLHTLLCALCPFCNLPSPPLWRLLSRFLHLLHLLHPFAPFTPLCLAALHCTPHALPCCTLLRTLHRTLHRCHGSNRFDMIKAYRRHILSHNHIH